ncbi:TRAP-T family protein transporter, DctP (Periplasmic binding) subunit [Alloalcanivorax dieselolei B5]|uniref:TRAP-T family protein transporter, DctP (Periplasmic binding) subunit n=2 Tax=Alloalcanivorax dieselolei TaxID=285091 RepID=K0CEC5_ALCDB|nr:TRAP-T family protein transporter, DctP (Periplasmic binding) subunit [Alloalcanivorax dieselolei B5]
MMKLRRCLALLAFAAVFMSGPGYAKSLRFASGYPPNSVAEQAAQKYTQVLKDETDGALSARVFSLTLLNLLESSAGVRDGMADAAVVLFPYFPGEYPRINMLAEISMLLNAGGEDPAHAGLIFTGAFSEFLFQSCPGCQKELAAQNQVFLGSGSTPTLPLLCTTPIREAKDLTGKRVRTSGAQWARWVEKMGATPITMSVNEIYEGLNQGVVDCTVQTTTELSIFKLDEVVTDITLGVPGGVFGGSGVNNMNRDTWRGLSDAERRAVLKASAVFSAEASWGYDALGAENLAAAKENGITVHQAGETFRVETQAFIDKDVETIAENYRTRHGVENAAELIDAFRPLLQRWQDLVDGVESPEQLAQLYWREVFSKVDPARYGM